jgi:hypothetical protein
MFYPRDLFHLSFIISVFFPSISSLFSSISSLFFSLPLIWSQSHNVQFTNSCICVKVKLAFFWLLYRLNKKVFREKKFKYLLSFCNCQTWTFHCLYLEYKCVIFFKVFKRNCFVLFINLHFDKLHRAF